MSRVLALGGAGFIGSYVVRDLLERGHEVVAVDNFSKYGALSHDFFPHPKFTLRTGDVRQMLPHEFAGFDTVLCLAALIGGIKYFHRIPYRIARDNTDILTHAIDCTLAASPKATFVYFSSSMVYERVQHPVTEADTRTQAVPMTNYGMQKLFGEYLVEGAHQEYGLQYLIVRPFNAVGSGELPVMKSDGEVDFGAAHVIPDFLHRALIKQSPFEIFGDGEQVRTFTHAKDIAEALARILEKKVVNDDFNLCGNATSSVAELATKIWALVNPGTAFPGFKHTPAPASDVRFRVGVSEKAKRVLGWEPRIGLDFILSDTLRYIQESRK